ncbi:MAG TPA: hypothetical protein VMW26_01465 [Methanomassiliicoccales archaeon]|nr:hypothetical protein [Methanomassiliicoccales archaeon]
MKMLGTCSQCGKPTDHTCPMCGRSVCAEHRDRETGLCQHCRGRKPTDPSERTLV